MYIYEVKLRQEDGFFTAESEAFQISCSADDPTDAVNSLNGELAKEIILLMRKGKPVPPSCEISLGGGGIYMQVDADRLFRESFKSTMVRRQVSLPAWMDYKLRLYGTDVSKLLQKAAQKEIKKYERLK